MRIVHPPRIIAVAILLAVALILSACAPIFSQPLLGQTHFYEMIYERPSYEELRSLCDDALAELRAEKPNYRKATLALDDFFASFSTYFTMESLANLYYSADTQREDYRKECDFFVQHSVLVEKCREEIMVAAANSKIRSSLETVYFMTDLSEYEEYARYTDDEYLQMSLDEAKIIRRYRDTVSDATVNEKNVWEALGECTNAEAYRGILTSFFEKYTSILGQTYHELTEIRCRMAKHLGIDSYILLAGEGLGREMSMDQMKGYLSQLKRTVTSVKLDQSQESATVMSRTIGERELHGYLRDVCTEMDEVLGYDQFSTLHEYMLTYGLCDLSLSPRKEGTSFTTYLYDYYEPYVFLSPEGNYHDLTTLFHEFGHFTEMGYSGNTASSIDLAEVYSEGFEMLAVQYMPAETKKQKELRTALFDREKEKALDTFRYQGLLTDFEMTIFDPASKIDTSDPDALCYLFAELSVEWGYHEDENDIIARSGWITVPHIFQYPSYVFSYCIASDIALQLGKKECDKRGSGLEIYASLLERDNTDDFVTVLTKAGLSSPFESGHCEALIPAFLACSLPLRESEGEMR